MPTVIDSLVLELGLDPAKFTQGQRDALNSLRQMQQESVAGGKQVEEQTRRIGNLLTDFRRQAVQTISVFLGGMGIKEFTSYVTNLDATTARLGKTMNMSASDVGVWQGAIKQAGGSTEGANAALAGLSGEMNRFMLTGQSAMLPVLSRLGISLLDQNRNLKTSGQLWLDIAESIQGMDTAKATAFLSMIPGATQDMINFALLGPSKMREYLEAARQAGTTTKESAEEAIKYQRALALLDQSATNLGRTLVTNLAPALIATLDAMRKFIAGPSDETKKDTARILGIKSDEPTIWEKMVSRLTGLPVKGRQYHLGTSGPIEGTPVAPSAAPSPPAGPPGASRTPSTVPLSEAAVEAIIRREAAANGIDPDQAVRVWSSEGRRTYTGDRGSSFGPFQLHYGGVAPGMMQTGLGDEFTRRTGLDARDPSTLEAQIKFSMKEVARGGWGPWKGWKGDPWAGVAPGARAAAFEGAGGRGGATGGGAPNVTIGTITVNTQATDAGGIAKEIGPALRREITAGSANQGPL